MQKFKFKSFRIYTLIALSLAVFIFIGAKGVSAASDNFDTIYASMCQKNSNNNGIVAYICSLRMQNDDLKSQVSQLQAQVPSEVVLFSEQFNGNQLDSNRWDVRPNGGTVAVANGDVTLDAPTGGTAIRPPFVQIKPIPYFDPPKDPSTVSFQWRMKYNRIGSGMGLMFTTGNVDPDSTDPNVTNINALPFVGGVWTDGLRYNSNGSHNFAPIPTDGAYHSYQIDFHGFYYYYFLDGKLMYTDRTFSPYDINSVFFGAFGPGATNGSSSISIDYLKITAPSYIPQLP